MSEDRPYRIGSVSPSPRKASPTYQEPNPRAPTPGLKVVPGFEQNNAPNKTTSIPWPPAQSGQKPFSVR